MNNFSVSHFSKFYSRSLSLFLNKIGFLNENEITDGGKKFHDVATRLWRRRSVERKTDLPLWISKIRCMPNLQSG